ncbi:MAG TPA: hypothetical protein VJ692_10285 [Nitrospiraceae bacterium]|nr:hypothetical protein [Nitrospiraceae bacterium]
MPNRFASRAGEALSHVQGESLRAGQPFDAACYLPGPQPFVGDLHQLGGDPPKHPLADAIHQVVEGILAAYRHLEEREVQFTQQDMHFFDRLHETMWIQYFHSIHILDDARRCLAKQSAVPAEKPPSSKR